MFHAKIKVLEFETKNVLLGIFSLKLRKNDCDIWNQHPRIAKNCACKTKK